MIASLGLTSGTSEGVPVTLPLKRIATSRRASRDVHSTKFAVYWIPRYDKIISRPRRAAGIGVPNDAANRRYSGMDAPARCDVMLMYSFYGVRFPAQGGFDKKLVTRQEIADLLDSNSNESLPESDSH